MHVQCKKPFAQVVYNVCYDTMIWCWRHTWTTSPPRLLSETSGIYFCGLVSSCSRKTPSSVIFPRICLSQFHTHSLAFSHTCSSTTYWVLWHWTVSRITTLSTITAASVNNFQRLLLHYAKLFHHMFQWIMLKAMFTETYKHWENGQRPRVTFCSSGTILTTMM